ncbi:MAG TPA: hypothetical protein VN628_04075 [Vicinamibacterales bacterium]|nr:hypothetical protein [Vicinamibacterales bacterium]
MRRRVAGALLGFALAAVPAVAAGQTPAPRRPAARKPPALPAPIKEAPEIVCPTPLGTGVNTKLDYCDVMTGRDVTAGVLVRFPEHKGPVTLSFDLHNRHTYSEEQVKANRAYSHYTASIGVLTMDNTLVQRAVVDSEFRKVTDFVDRIGGGAGPAGIKAVAPVGTEMVSMQIPEEENEVSILGEKLTVERLDGTATYSSPGRPIAVISNVMIEYRPPPPTPAAKAPARKK